MAKSKHDLNGYDFSLFLDLQAKHREFVCSAERRLESAEKDIKGALQIEAYFEERGWLFDQRDTKISVWKEIWEKLKKITLVDSGKCK